MVKDVDAIEKLDRLELIKYIKYYGIPFEKTMTKEDIIGELLKSDKYLGQISICTSLKRIAWKMEFHLIRKNNMSQRFTLTLYFGKMTKQMKCNLILESMMVSRYLRKRFLKFSQKALKQSVVKIYHSQCSWIETGYQHKIFITV